MSGLPGIRTMTWTQVFRRRVLSQAWLWWLCAAVSASAVSLAVGPFEFEAVIGAATLAVIVVGIGWHGPAAPRAWVLLAVAQATATAAVATWVSIFIVTHRHPGFPTVIDVVYLASDLIFAAGLALFIRRRAGRSPWEGVLDASLVTLGLAALLWALEFDPYLDASGTPPLVLIAALAYPSMDLLLLAMLAWLVFTAGLRTRSLILLAAAVTVLLAADIVNGTLEAHGGNGAGNALITFGWDLSYALLGAAALHPSMAQTLEQDSARASAASRGRVAVYLVLAAAGPAVAAAAVLSDGHRSADTLVPLGITAAIAALLVVRLAQIAALASDRATAIDRQAAELEVSRQELLRAHQRATAIFESAPTGMAQLAPDWTIVAANGALAGLLGVPASRLAGQDIAGFVHPGDAEGIRGLLRGTLRHEDRGSSCEGRLLDDRGTTVWASWVASAVHNEDGLTAIVVIADRTEARRLEIELRHAQKLEGIGRLAAGVAHELNTPIQFIGDNVDFLGDVAAQLLAATAGASGNGDAPAAGGLDLEYLAAEIPEAVRQTRDGVHRVATIVQALKSFAHPETHGQVPADINRALTDTLTIARSELRAIGRVDTDLGQLPPVTCSVGDLNQVFLNLLINAADAVAETQAPEIPGRITVRSRRNRDSVVIEISDTGPGIPDELRDKVFEPFFTTKPVGQGTGQGLALARNIIVDRHGGTIGYTSIPGQGTTFTVTLPVAGHGTPVPATATTISGASNL
jgi:PAS domain S-box-containing protein